MAARGVASAYVDSDDDLEAAYRPPKAKAAATASMYKAAPAAASPPDASTAAAPISALSRQFLSDLDATHHRAEFQDRRELQRAYTAKLKGSLATLEEDDAAAGESDEAFSQLVALRKSQAGIVEPPESPTQRERREVIARKVLISERLRRVGVPCSDPDVGDLGIGSAAPGNDEPVHYTV